MVDILLFRLSNRVYDLIPDFSWVAFLYVRLRFRISFLIAVVIQGGSDGLTLTVLFGTHSAVKEFI